VVAHAVLQTDQITQKNAAPEEQSAWAGTELNRFAAGLQTLVNGMREMAGSACPAGM